MRQSPHPKRPRGGRSPGRRGNSQGGNRTFESNGPSVKIRGSAGQLFEKYQALARDATTSGDRVAAENYFQHAEHYFRVMTAANGGHQRAQPPMATQPPPGQPPPEQAAPEARGNAEAKSAGSGGDGSDPVTV